MGPVITAIDAGHYEKTVIHPARSGQRQWSEVICRQCSSEMGVNIAFPCSVIARAKSEQAAYGEKLRSEILRLETAVNRENPRRYNPMGGMALG